MGGAETRESAAELLTLRRDAIRVIDGAGPVVEIHPHFASGQGSERGDETGEEPVPAPPRQRQKKTETPMREDPQRHVNVPRDAESEASTGPIGVGQAVAATALKRDIRRLRNPSPNDMPLENQRHPQQMRRGMWD
jgi:hypothetical protein